MTQVLLRKEAGGLRPHDDEAYRVLSKIASGSAVVADIRDKARRSNRQHSFWFVLVGLLYESQEYYKDFEHYRKALLIHLGYCEKYKQRDGSVIAIATSIAFHKMSPDEFGTLVDRTLDFAVEQGFDRDALLAETRERSGIGDVA